MKLQLILPCLLAGLTLLIRNVAAADPPTDPERFHVFLLAGQSNMAGRAKIEPEDAGEIEGAFLWNIGEKQWEPAKAPLNRYSPNRKPMNLQRLNCGPSFARAYRKVHPGVSVGIVCAARGGTAIHEWAKGWTKPFPMYDAALAAIRDALKSGGTLKGILWHQGESDSLMLEGYEEEFAKVLTTFRKDLGQPRLPIVFGQAGQWNPDYRAFNELIVKQPEKIPHSACVTTEGLTNMDRAHFDTRSQRILGERYAEAMMGLMGGEG